MALFKVLKGNRSALGSQALHDGYAYFCVDDGSFHIDYTDADGNLQRKQLNAKDAETLTGMTLEEIRKSISWNDLTDKPFYETTEYIEVANIANCLFGNSGANDQYIRDRGIRLTLKDDTTYIVRIGGNEYTVRSYKATVHSQELVVIGGEPESHGRCMKSDSSYPFSMYSTSTGTLVAIWRETNVVEGTVTLSFTIHEEQEVVKPLDPKFLPSEIARTSDVDTALATKAEVEHTHEISDVNGLQTALDNLELITVEDIDTICGTVIQLASETTF
ncbi:MAG: hypothetical protein IIW48_08835 [Clostridia bacterium]|nr:hypothetical protein [Clostridia bacterium]